MSNDGKLYVKSTCLVCHGKITICHYCDNGLTHVEAADTIVVQWLKSLPKERLQSMLNLVKDENS